MNYKVSQINYFIKQIILSEEILYNISIEGEISNFKLHKSGHMFFTLKDELSTLKCVFFKNDAERIEFFPKDGTFVTVRGDIRVYEKDGIYQLYGHQMIEGGEGSFKLKLENTFKKLENLGVFDKSKKRSIPLYPNKIGVITAPNSAAFTDIVNIIDRRYPIATIKFFPSLVQGKDSIKQLCDAISKANKSDIDLLIIGRGGGQVEDLSSFDNEDVVLAISNFKVPVISAVGHEKDNSLIDLAADLRASTPSAAAELAVPDKDELKRNIDLIKKMLYNNMSKKVIENEQLFINLSNRLNKVSFSNKIKRNLDKLNYLQFKLNSTISNKFNKYNQTLYHLDFSLKSLNPLNTLKRGYSLAFDKNNLILKDVKDVNVGDDIKLKLINGEINAKIINIKETE